MTTGPEAPAGTPFIPQGHLGCVVFPHPPGSQGLRAGGRRLSTSVRAQFHLPQGPRWGALSAPLFLPYPTTHGATSGREALRPDLISTGNRSEDRQVGFCPTKEVLRQKAVADGMKRQPAAAGSYLHTTRQTKVTSQETQRIQTTQQQSGWLGYQ